MQSLKWVANQLVVQHRCCVALKFVLFQPFHANRRACAYANSYYIQSESVRDTRKIYIGYVYDCNYASNYSFSPNGIIFRSFFSISSISLSFSVCQLNTLRCFTRFVIRLTVSPKEIELHMSSSISPDLVCVIFLSRCAFNHIDLSPRSANIIYDKWANVCHLSHTFVHLKFN